MACKANRTAENTISIHMGLEQHEFKHPKRIDPGCHGAASDRTTTTAGIEACYGAAATITMAGRSTRPARL
ncbi:hypothetical protein JHS3_19590 [Jeongeupia sp. HS-3]|nr:hypothetical protein JHS3_19590 [Jeongeupia sp. HS-3]